MPALYSPKELNALDPNKVPYHVAIIPDGNRRFAKNQVADYAFGHTQGAETLVNIALAARELQIKVLTVYTFSTENWKRTENEVTTLLQMVRNYLVNKEDDLIHFNVRLKIIGDKTKLPKELLDVMNEMEEKTKSFTDFTLVLAVNYGGKNELTRAINTLLHQGISLPSDEALSDYLDTKGIPDPDLLIRSGGEFRLSNFLPWQTTYTELYFTPTFWPEFTAKELLKAVIEYQQRQMRRGA